MYVLNENGSFRSYSFQFSWSLNFEMVFWTQSLGDGNHEEVQKLDTKLAELEERAEELDKMRTSTIASIALINDRNRKNNILRAEKGIKEEIL